MRTTLLCCLLLAATAVQALETPLILKSQTGVGDQMVVINPSMGTLQLYRSNINQLEQVDTGNFLSDLDYIRNVPTPGKLEWPLLRVGLTNMSPTYGEMFDVILPQMSRKPKRGEEGLTLAQKAMNSEDQFFEKLPEYDGIVRGAALTNSFVLIIPSTYTLLFYTVENMTLEFTGWRNYRVDMYIPQVYQSQPTPQNLLNALGDEAKGEREEAMKQQMEELGDQAGQIIPLQPSDPWVGASEANGQVYVLVDPPNKRMVAYQYQARGRVKGLLMHSARNLEIDLMIPTVFNAIPNNADLVKRYNKVLAKEDMPQVFREEIEQLASASAVTSDKMSTFQAIIDGSGVLQLDFQSERQLLTYRITASGIDLATARDYTIETGIGIHRDQIVKRHRAAKMKDNVEGAIKADEFEGAFKLLEIAFGWNPWLVDDWAKDRTIKKLEKEDGERWIKLITETQEKAKRLDEERTQLIEAAREKAKQREARR